jgi:hypothetical protein
MSLKVCVSESEASFRSGSSSVVRKHVKPDSEREGVALKMGSRRVWSLFYWCSGSSFFRGRPAWPCRTLVATTPRVAEHGRRILGVAGQSCEGAAEPLLEKSDVASAGGQRVLSKGILLGSIDGGVSLGGRDTTDVVGRYVDRPITTRIVTEAVSCRHAAGRHSRELGLEPSQNPVVLSPLFSAEATRHGTKMETGEVVGVIEMLA